MRNVAHPRARAAVPAAAVLATALVGPLGLIGPLGTGPAHAVTWQRPLPPAGLVSRNSGTSLLLSWEQPVNGAPAVAFEVLEGGKVVARNDTTSAVVENLPMGSRHTYTVRALDALGRKSQPSAPVTDTVTPPRGILPCQAPAVTGLTATDVTSSSLTLSWTDPMLTDASYDLPSSGRTYTVLVDGVAATTTWTSKAVHLSGLKSATAVSLAVRTPGCDWQPEPVVSASLSVTTKAGSETRPPAPVLVNVVSDADSDDSLSLSWTPPASTAGVDHWAVYLDGRLALRTLNATTTKATIDGLWWGETYQVAVVGVGWTREESAAARTHASLLNCRTSGIAGPRQVQVKALSASTLLVTWAQDSQPVSTAIQVDGETVQVTQALGSARISGLASGPHTVVVDPQMQVRNAPCGDAPAAAPVTVTLPAGPPARPQPPTAFAAQLPDMPGYPTSTVSLTWKAPTTGTPAVQYRIFDDSGKQRAASKTTRAKVKLAAGTTTTLRIVAVDAAGMESAPATPLIVRVMGPLYP